jgi:hypothetical protein
MARGNDGGKGGRLEAAPEALQVTEDGVELAVRLHNPLDRAIHYISDVRGVLFDPATQRLRVQLSDRGREVIPGGMMMLPRFRMVDPHGDAVTTIRLPRTIVKLAEGGPPGEVRFEEHVVADAEAIDVEIGWSDTPYYDDPRERDSHVPPVAEWEQDAARVSFETGEGEAPREGEPVS